MTCRGMNELTHDVLFVCRVICVAGAGRGPLVARCLNAIERAKREAFVYAVEKNPNAFVTYVDPSLFFQIDH